MERSYLALRFLNVATSRQETEAEHCILKAQAVLGKPRQFVNAGQKEVVRLDAVALATSLTNLAEKIASWPESFCCLPSCCFFARFNFSEFLGQHGRGQAFVPPPSAAPPPNRNRRQEAPRFDLLFRSAFGPPRSLPSAEGLAWLGREKVGPPKQVSNLPKPDRCFNRQGFVLFLISKPLAAPQALIFRRKVGSRTQTGSSCRLDFILADV